MNQGSIGRQDGKGTGALTRPRQLQYQIIPADQQIGFGVLRQLQKHLVIRIPAFGQRRQTGIARCYRYNRQMSPVALNKIVSAGVIEAKLGVPRDPFQFGQRAVVGQADHLVMVNRLSQRGQWRCLKMKQIHHHIGVQYQSGAGRYD